MIMDGVNLTQVTGLVTKPVDLRKTGAGKPVVTMIVTTKFRGKASHHRAVLWGAAAEFAAKTTKVGDIVYVAGPLVYREETNASGEVRVSAEINVINYQLLSSGDRGLERESGPPRDYAEINGNTI
jgi:single-stranded DNA-binding protein